MTISWPFYTGISSPTHHIITARRINDVSKTVFHYAIVTIPEEYFVAVFQYTFDPFFFYHRQVEKPESSVDFVDPISRVGKFLGGVEFTLGGDEFNWSRCS